MNNDIYETINGHASQNRTFLPPHGVNTDMDTPSSLKIYDVNFGEAASKFLENGERHTTLYADVHFDLSEETDMHRWGGVPFCAQVYAVDKITEQSELLVSCTDRLQAQKFDYRVHLEFAAPGYGYYQLNTVVFLLNANPAIDLMQGPLLRVEI